MASSIETSSPAKIPISQEEMMAKIESKFGKKANFKKPEPKVEAPAPKADSAEISKSAKIKKSMDDRDTIIGDIGKNDPQDEITQEKLKSILSTNAFHFTEKERDALKDILK